MTLQGHRTQDPMGGRLATSTQTHKPTNTGTHKNQKAHTIKFSRHSSSNVIGKREPEKTACNRKEPVGEELEEHEHRPPMERLTPTKHSQQQYHAKSCNNHHPQPTSYPKQPTSSSRPTRSQAHTLPHETSHRTVCLITRRATKICVNCFDILPHALHTYSSSIASKGTNFVASASGLTGRWAAVTASRRRTSLFVFACSFASTTSAQLSVCDLLFK